MIERFLAAKKFEENFYVILRSYTMENLIKALQIFLKHGDVAYPTHCEHDVLYIFPQSDDFTDEELAELEKLGFYHNDDAGYGFKSYHYGSC